jgi:PAS domain S-box-containing protein
MLMKAEHEAFDIDWVSTYEEAMDAFEADKHEIYFLDYFLEDRTGLDLLKEARSKGIDAPIIMLTGRGSRSVDMEAMDLGASDYLVKGLIDPDALERSIRHALERAEGARAIKEREERLGTAHSAQEPGPEPRQPAPASHAGDTARFWALFDSTRSGVALVDLDGSLLKVNQPFAETFSPSPRFTEGLSFLDLLEENDKEAVGKELEALAKGERPRFEAARRFQIREGEIIWAHTTSVLIRNADGDPDHLMVLLERVAEKR